MKQAHIQQLSGLQMKRSLCAKELSWGHHTLVVCSYLDSETTITVGLLFW